MVKAARQAPAAVLAPREQGERVSTPAFHESRSCSLLLLAGRTCTNVLGKGRAAGQPAGAARRGIEAAGPGECPSLVWRVRARRCRKT